MPSALSGFPNCTKWKNYRYPLTRLGSKVGYTIDTASEGAFAVAPLDIWISDDYFLMGSNIEYVVTMTSSTNDMCKSLKRPQIFVDGVYGSTTETTAGSANPFFKLGVGAGATTDGIQNLCVHFGSASATASIPSTLSRNVLPQSLYTIAPGLHFGFSTTSHTAYSTGDVFKWTMDSTALNNLGKVMDGTYTCWYKLPIDAGSTVTTEPFPSGLRNKSFNLMWNSVRHIGKRSTTAANNGQSAWLQGSLNKVNWVDITELVDDIDVAVTHMAQAKWDTNALDGDDYPYKRLKFEFEASSSEIDFHPHQFIEVGITPN